MNTQSKIETAIQEYNNLADSLHMGYNHHIHGGNDIAGLRAAVIIGHMLILPREAQAGLIRALRLGQRLETNPEE